MKRRHQCWDDEQELALHHEILMEKRMGNTNTKQIQIQIQILTISKQEKTVASWGRAVCCGSTHRLDCHQPPNCELGPKYYYSLLYIRIRKTWQQENHPNCELSSFFFSRGRVGSPTIDQQITSNHSLEWKKKKHWKVVFRRSSHISAHTECVCILICI